MTILGLQFSGLGLLSSSYNLFPIPNGALANEGQGDLVSRLVRGISRVTYGLLGL